MDETYYTAEQVAEHFGGQISVKTLAKWRSERTDGPPYLKAGGKVLYPVSQLLEWAKRRTITSTRELKETPDGME